MRTDPASPSWRRLASRIVPLRDLYRWWTGVITDLRLYLLTLTGQVPSHRFRNLVYRRAGVQLAPTSSIPWRARFFAPEGLVIADWTMIGNDAFLDVHEGISIGSYVNIAAEGRIYTREHDVDDPYFRETGASVAIEDYAYPGHARDGPPRRPNRHRGGRGVRGRRRRGPGSIHARRRRAGKTDQGAPPATFATGSGMPSDSSDMAARGMSPMSCSAGSRIWHKVSRSFARNEPTLGTSHLAPNLSRIAFVLLRPASARTPSLPQA